MYDSMAPVEFKSLLDPTWRQHQEEALSEFIEKELEKDQSPEAAVKNIDNEFDLLSRTIKKHFMTLMSSSLQAAQKAAYEDAGIENYKVIAVIDDNTCEKCVEVNDKVLPVKDYEIAKTAPPYHFYCRCTTMPYTSDSADKTGTHNAVVLFIKEFISQAASITINNLSWANILDLPSKVKGIIELVYELAKVSEALRKKEISINDVKAALGDKAKDIFIGDLIYIFENYKKFGNLSELSEQDIKELAGRTAGAYEEAVAAGFTIYGISKSLSQITKKISIANAKKVPPKPSTSSNGAGQYADDVIEGAGSKPVYNANGDQALRATRRPAFDNMINNGVEVNGINYKLNEHAYNSMFKSGRKDIMPADISDALKAKPLPGNPGSFKYVNPATGTKVFVNPSNNEIVGIWPAGFGD